MLGLNVTVSIPLCAAVETQTKPHPGYMEKVDLSVIAGIYVTEDPRGYAGIKMWCGYCCTPLHYDMRHMGTSPFLTLMVKMADAHRDVECPNPKGPFVSEYEWSPRDSEQWATARQALIASEQGQ
jgi:hypothetical protein